MEDRKIDEVKISYLREKENGEVEYSDGKDWKIYNPDKYRDPEWDLDKE